MWLISREIIFLFKIEQNKCLKYYFVQLVNFNFSSNGLKKMQRKFSNNKLQEKEYLCLLALLFCLEHNLS